MAHPTTKPQRTTALPPFVLLAEEALGKGELEKAQALAADGLRTGPDHPLGRVVLGKVLLLQGRAVEARDEFARALSMAPEDGALYASVGAALLERGLFRSAARMLQRAVALSPGDPSLEALLSEAERGGADPVVRIGPPVVPPPVVQGPKEEENPSGEMGREPSGPPRIPRRPPPLGQAPSAREEPLLDWLEEIPLPESGPAEPEPEVEQVAAEALSAAAAYEQELRERLVGSGEDRPRVSRKGRLGRFLAVALLIACGAGFGAYEYRRSVNREADIERFTAAARNGVVRDTRAAWVATITALDEVLDRDPSHETARALKALALATLGRTFGAPGYKPQASEELIGTAEVEKELEVVLATRWLLTGEGEEKRALEEEILGLDPATAGATVHSLAGAILLDRKDPAAAIERFNRAISSSPGHVPTLVRVADYYRSRGEHTDALRYYQLALAVAEDHPLAVLGAAESQLSLGGDVPTLKGALSALDKAGTAASFPVASRSRRSVVRARLLAALDRRDDALAELESALPDSSDPARVAAVALAFVQVGAPERAESLVGPVQADSPLVLREARARALLAQERYRLLGPIPVKPGERQLHLLKGIALFHLGDWNAARAAFRATGTEQGGRLPADAVVYLALVDRITARGDKGRQTLERLGTSPRARTAARWAWASVLGDEGRWDEAEEVLTGAVARDPQAVEPHCALGRLLLGRGDRTGAAQALEVALRLNPHHTEARIALARLALQSGAGEEAARQLDRVFGVHPDLAQAWAMRAAILSASGESERAKRAADRALALGPKDPLALAVGGQVAREEGDLPKALRLARAAVAADGADVAHWLQLAELQLQFGDGKAAHASFSRALVVSPGHVEARAGLAASLIARGLVGDALPLLDELLGNLPEGAPPSLRARLLAWQGLAATSAGREGGEGLGRALELSPDLPDVVLAAALVHQHRGEVDQAATAFRRARELAPNRPDIVLASARFFRHTGEGPRSQEAYRRYLELAPSGLAAGEARKAVGRR